MGQYTKGKMLGFVSQLWQPGLTHIFTVELFSLVVSKGSQGYLFTAGTSTVRRAVFTERFASMGLDFLQLLNFHKRGNKTFETVILFLFIGLAVSIQNLQ